MVLECIGNKSSKISLGLMNSPLWAIHIQVFNVINLDTACNVLSMKCNVLLILARISSFCIGESRA